MSTTPDAPPLPDLPPEYRWTPRISMDQAEAVGAESQAALERFRRDHRALNNMVRQVAHVPAAVDLLNTLSTVHQAATLIDRRVLEAVRLRVAVATGCQYCTAWHVRFAEGAGFSDAEVAAISDLTQTRPPELETDVQLGVAVAHELSTGTVTAETFAEAVARWGETGAIQLVMSAAAQNATSRIGAALKTPMEPAYAKLLARKAQRSS